MAAQALYGVPRPPGPALQPRPRLYAPRPEGDLSGPNYAATGTDLGGGDGSWASPGNAAGGDDDTFAVWTVP